jgi:hypothetical protein
LGWASVVLAIRSSLHSTAGAWHVSFW